jgi:hypothetical protein
MKTDTKCTSVLQHKFNVPLQIKHMTSYIETRTRIQYILLSNVAYLKTVIYNLERTGYPLMI